MVIGAFGAGLSNVIFCDPGVFFKTISIVDIRTFSPALVFKWSKTRAGGKGPVEQIIVDFPRNGRKQVGEKVQGQGKMFGYPLIFGGFTKMIQPSPPPFSTAPQTRGLEGS